MNCGHSHTDSVCARARNESGQVLVLVAVALIVLIGLVGLAIDVGYAYYTQRALQASTDAAALAGAQELPDPGQAAATAQAYGGASGAKNERANVPGVSTTVTTRCLASAPGCQPANAIAVTQQVEVDTVFARVLGIDSFDVRTRATACSPCAGKALDIMLVLDRTGSMCQDRYGRGDPACTDLNNARQGMKTFLGFLDPRIDWVGLAVLPPARSVSARCATPTTENYDSTSSPYVIVALANDYSAGGTLDASSDLVATIECQEGGGRTSYANAIEQAQDELDRGGRPDVQDVVILLSDGAANIGPAYYDPTSPYRAQPCRQGVTSALALRAGGTAVYTIGYDLDALGGDANRCTSFTGADESPPITAYGALQGMASEPDNFYNKPDPGQLNTIFTRIAADISRPAARLISDDAS